MFKVLRVYLDGSSSSRLRWRWPRLGLGAAGVSAAAAAGEVYTLTNGARRERGQGLQPRRRRLVGARRASSPPAARAPVAGSETRARWRWSDRLLFAVNPGSDSISSFRVQARRARADRHRCFGWRPADQPHRRRRRALRAQRRRGRKHQRPHVLPGRSAVAPRRIHKAAERRRRGSCPGVVRPGRRAARRHREEHQPDRHLRGRRRHRPRQRSHRAPVGWADAVRLRVRQARAPDRLRGVRRVAGRERRLLL